MPKGIFTQGVCVLFDRSLEWVDLESVLQPFEIRSRLEGCESWEFGGPTMVVVFRPEVNGHVAVDIVNRKWPDHMGDAGKESVLFGAWSMGQFGPFAFPGGLRRATEHSWAWEEGKTMQAKHMSFVRVRCSYVFGADDDAKVMPEDCEPITELDFLMKIATALLEIPGALCYFNPNGEVLRDQDGLRECLNFAWSIDIPALEAWSNIRLFNVDEEWSMMDTVGNSQLDIPDLEACFMTEHYDMNEVDDFLRRTSWYILTSESKIEDGDTVEGPGKIPWRCLHQELGLCDPPRSVIRCFPLDERVPPEGLDGSTP